MIDYKSYAGDFHTKSCRFRYLTMLSPGECADEKIDLEVYMLLKISGEYSLVNDFQLHAYPNFDSW